MAVLLVTWTGDKEPGETVIFDRVWDLILGTDGLASPSPYPAH